MPATAQDPGGTPIESPSPTAEVTPASPSPSIVEEHIDVDTLVQIVVDDLSVRTEPATGADRIGLIGHGEPAYVVGGPIDADGYAWYQLASVRSPYTGECGEPAEPPYLECAPWFGWVAGATADGEEWLEPLAAECPAARDTAAYLALQPAARLVCAGREEWRLLAYVAPEAGGRGCYPVWVTNPGWLEPACNFVFPQPIESQVDSDSRLQVFVHPDLGACGLQDEVACPFAALSGSWVEMVGHLDDPAASTCVAELSSTFEEAPYPPPDPASVAFRCRLAFVVTAVHATQPPR